ncbi:hypothetical protein ZIOFF_037696 [Zingiber officinale]|uniref:Uncharacterized protein n=1 Tax=Zingiber officinale TaxID=94328 RepID=A0A8J5GDJ7_ZINOF|nr:hypothetical protein ZIOFF_037696 [Zingiber officinale]
MSTGSGVTCETGRGFGCRLLRDVMFLELDRSWNNYPSISVRITIKMQHVVQRSHTKRYRSKRLANSNPYATIEKDNGEPFINRQQHEVRPSMEIFRFQSVSRDERRWLNHELQAKVEELESFYASYKLSTARRRNQTEDFGESAKFDRDLLLKMVDN